MHRSRRLIASTLLLACVVSAPLLAAPALEVPAGEYRERTLDHAADITNVLP